MERSCKILHKIASASHRVITAANEYADRKDLSNVERAHFQLEEDMRKISAACKCLASVLFAHGPVFDERLKDWLSSDEPRICSETLHQMARLLREDASSWTSIGRRIRGKTATKDKIDEAVNLFDSCKRCFHFLFATDIWNNESGVQQKNSAQQSRDTNIQDGPPILTNPSTTSPEVADHDGTCAVMERRHETKDDEEKKKENAKKLEEILIWLDGLNCAEKQDVTLSLRQADTCKWLFDTTQYKTWRDGANSFLWLRGKPGAGKSVLASSVINSLEESRCDEELLAFFYCDFRNEQSTHAAEVTRSILSQLLRQLRANGVDPGSCIDGLIKAKERGGAAMKNAKQLAVFVSHVTELLVQKPLVIVDALDECKDVRELLQALTVFRSRVRLFVTSRPVHAIMGDLSGLPFVSMDNAADELSADIELHVTRELDARPRLRHLDNAFKTEIRSVLCRKADGMFRWVQCSIDTLNRCVTRREVRDALNNLPEGLDETYERILRAIDMNAREGQLAQRALVWLVAALRPLHLEELMEGLSIDLHTRTLDSDLQPMHNGALLDACGSLVTYFEKTGLIILSHFSVKEYLTGEFTRSHLSRYHINWGLANLHLARSCMCYISTCLNHTQRPGRSRSTVTHVPSVCLEHGNHPHFMFQPLRDYVLDHALDHFNHLGPQINLILHDIKVLERDTQTHSRTWDNMCLSANRVMHCTTPSWPTSRHDFAFYILMAFGRNSDLREFLRHSGLRPKEGTNPLVYAAYFNKHEHARTLLSRGAKLNRRGWDPDGICQISPVEVAFRNHHYDIVTLFVAEGSPVPLHTFAMLCHHNDYARIPSLIVKILLQTDDFAEVATSLLAESLLRPLALSNYFLDNDVNEQDLIVITRRLIQVGYDPFGAISRRDILIRIAAGHGHVAPIHYLLSLGFSLPSDLLVRVNLHLMQNATHMIRYLVENGANTLAHNDIRESVLHISLATFGEHEALETSKLLVAHRCDPREANSRGETPLHIAVKQGYVSVVQYLLSLGIPLPPNLLVTLGLQRIRSGARMVRYLVDNGANALTRTSDGDSVLHFILATFDEHDALETAKFLIARGCDTLEVNSRGKTPFRITVERRHVSVARYLLSLDVPLPSDLLVPLNSAAMWDGAQMIRLLVENGFDLLSRNADGDSLFQIALYTFHEDEVLETVKVLLARGCNPLEAHHHGLTPLHLAAQLGHVSVVQHILPSVVPLHSDRLLTSSLWGVRNRAKMIRYLVESGAITIAHTTTDGDPLLHAVLGDSNEHDALDTVKFLVARGCDPLEANSHGDTPLRIALEQGHVSVVHYLLSLGVPLPSDILTTSSLWRVENRARMFRDLLWNGANAHARTSDGDSVLHSSFEDCKEQEILEIAKLLVAHGCDLFQANSRGETPLLIAFINGYIAVARFLLSLGAALSSDLLTALRSRSEPACARMIHFLVENGFDVLSRTEYGDSLLHITLYTLDEFEAFETTKLLVAHGCDPLQANSRDETPIHTAIRRGHVFLAHYLLSLGAPLPRDTLFTALNWSHHYTHPQTKSEMIHFLIGQGANVLARRSNGDSLLHNAIITFRCRDFNVLEVITSLVDRGCDPAISNNDGITPLHVAVKEGNARIVKHLLSLSAPLPPDILFTGIENDLISRSLQMEVIEVLVASGCDTLARNKAGHTPLCAAVVRGNVAVADYLLSAMDNRPSEDLLSAAEMAPAHVRSKMMTMLKGRLARSGKS